jgi:hypothetical protein
METIRENLQNLILNTTNSMIQNKIKNFDCENLLTITEFVNSNSQYYISHKDSVYDIETRFETGCVLDDKPKMEIKQEKKGKGRPKKTEIDKLMNSIMTSINKYVEKEVTTITESITENFDINENHKNLKDSIEVKNINNFEKKDNMSMSEALIQASQGISIENADAIQKTFLEIPFEEEPEQISVEDMIINGKMYYVDSKNNVYDPESEEKIGKLDKKGTIIKN